MKTKHTKGIWKMLFTPLSRIHNNYIMCDNNDTKFGSEIATIHVKLDGKNDEAILEEAEANAKLISAAPELLEALDESHKLIAILINLLPKDMQNINIPEHRKRFDMEMQVLIRNEKAIRKATK